MNFYQRTRRRFRIWWQRTRRRLRTPLEIRNTIGYLRARVFFDDPHPLLQSFAYLAWLIFRVPWHFPCLLPPGPREIMAYPPKEYMRTHHLDTYNLQLIRLWRLRDTPQRSFFRIYEALCAGHAEFIGYETEYFFDRPKEEPPSRAWEIELLRDPREYGCDDPEQLAVLASLAEALAESFNWRLMWGLRRDGPVVDRTGPPVYVPVLKPPAWTATVPRLETRFVLHDFTKWRNYGFREDDINFTGDQTPWWKRNIEAGDDALRTV